MRFPELSMGPEEPRAGWRSRQVSEKRRKAAGRASKWLWRHRLCQLKMASPWALPMKGCNMHFVYNLET